VVLKKPKTMYKPYKKKIENTILKRGIKHKTENIIKKVFKNLQRNKGKKSGINVLKHKIITNTDIFSIGKQTLKKGKRKRKVSTKIVLSSGKARFSQACKNIVLEALKSKGQTFVTKFNKIVKVKEIEPSNILNSLNSLDTKHSVKFRW